MESDKFEKMEPITENQSSINGAESKTEARTMEEEVERIHAAFERGKLRRARAAERILDESRGSFMKLLFGNRAKSL